MPVTYEQQVFYSLEELYQRLKVTQQELIKLLTDKRFTKHTLNDGLYLEKNELESFVNELLLEQGSYQHYEIPEYLRNCTSAWAVTLVRIYQESFTYPDSISPEQGELLKTLVCNIAPKNILEIGCFTGVSTVWLAAGLEQIGSKGTVRSVDLFDVILPNLPIHRGYLSNPLEYAQKSVEAAQLSHRVKFYKNNSREVGEIDEILNETIDFLFIDGDHSIPGCLSDFLLFYLHVSIGGYIVLHDIYPECGHYDPRHVIDNYIKKSHFELLEVKTSPINYGIAVIRKLGEDKNIKLRTKLRETAI